MSLFARKAPEPDDLVVEATPADPAALRDEAEAIRTEAAKRAAHLLADGEAEAIEHLRQADQLDAEQATRAKVERYFAGVAEARVNFERATAMRAQAAAEADTAAAHRDGFAARHAEAFAAAGAARHAYERALVGNVELAEQTDLHLRWRACEAMPLDTAAQLDAAQVDVRSAAEAARRAADSVKSCWHRLEALSATDGLEPPPSLGLTKAEKRAQWEADLRRRDELMRVAANDPTYRQRQAEKAFERDRKRRIHGPALDPLTRQANAAATFLATRGR